MYKNIFIIALAITLFGCTQVIVRNAFKPASIQLQGERKIAFSVQPSADNTSDGVTVYGAPYKMLVFINYEEQDKALALRKMTLRGENGISLILPDKDRKIGSSGNQPPEGTTVIEYDISIIEYQPYTLSGEFISETGTSNKSYPINVLFDTDYKEEKVNRLLEALRGI